MGPGARVSAGPVAGAAAWGVLLALAAVWVAGLLDAVPAIIAVLAVLPLAGWAALVAAIGAAGRVPPSRITASFLWGALAAAPLAAMANAAARDAWGAALAGAGGVGTIAAPVIEELAKAVPIPLLLLASRRRGPRPVLAGMAIGGASGLGFAASENVPYLAIAAFQGGMAGLLQAAWARGVLSGVKHALFTATIGAGFGAARGRPSRIAAAGASLAGLLGGIAQHVAWNGVAARMLHDAICDAPVAGAPCTLPARPRALVVVAPLVVAVALAPGLLALAWLVRRLVAAARS